MNPTCQHPDCTDDAEFQAFHVCDPDGVFACEVHLGALLGFTCDHEPDDQRHSLAFHVFQKPAKHSDDCAIGLGGPCDCGAGHADD
ncbi:MAG: hypothetical protein ACODAA_00920 [Gemmatimonadota bacterium]